MNRAIFTSRMRGRFSAVLHKAAQSDPSLPIPGTARVACADSGNHLTNYGLNLIGLASDSSADFAYYYMAVGTGNTPESDSDTALAAEVARVSTSPTASGITRDLDSPVKSYTIWFTRRFPAGVATGNLTEVALLRGSGTPTNAVCRALFRNEDNEPIVIPKQADEILDVTYHLDVIIPHEDITGTINIAGVPTGFTLRPANADREWSADFSGDPGWPCVNPGTLIQAGFKATIQGVGVNTSDNRTALAGNVTVFQPYTGASITAISSPGNRAAKSVTYDAYVTDSFERKGILEWDSAAGNHASLNCLQIATQFGGYQVLFDTPFAKTNLEKLRLPFTIAWARG